MIKSSIYDQIPSLDRRVKFSFEEVGSGGKVNKTATFCVVFSGFTRAIMSAVVDDSKMDHVADIPHHRPGQRPRSRGCQARTRFFPEGTAAKLWPLDKLLTVYQDVFYKEDEVSIRTLPPIHFDVISGAKTTRIPPHHRSQEEDQMIEEEFQRFIQKV